MPSWCIIRLPVNWKGLPHEVLYIFFTVLLFSTNSIASAELVFDDKPLTLLLSDNNQARVANCSDFIALRKSGETVKDILDLTPPDQDLAEAALFDCYIKGYVIENQLHEIKSQKPSLGDILRHLPATEKIISSDEEMKKIAKDFKDRSIWDTSPDLVQQDDIFVSEIDYTGYRLIDSRTYISPQNKKIEIITLGSFALYGTEGTRKNYIINSKNNTLWDISKIDMNSSF